MRPLYSAARLKTLRVCLSIDHQANLLGKPLQHVFNMSWGPSHIVGPKPNRGYVGPMTPLLYRMMRPGSDEAGIGPRFAISAGVVLLRTRLGPPSLRLRMTCAIRVWSCVSGDPSRPSIEHSQRCNSALPSLIVHRP